jgi:hypothetical protein
MKKVLIIAALLGGAWYLHSQSTSADTSDVVASKPTELNDLQAKSYLEKNVDVANAWADGSAKSWLPQLQTDIDWAKFHWKNYGYNENRTF